MIYYETIAAADKRLHTRQIEERQKDGIILDIIRMTEQRNRFKKVSKL